MADSSKTIVQFVQQLKALDESDFPAAAVVMTFLGIDMMAYLSLPIDKSKQTRKDFMAWVDQYMECHPEQPYKYRGKDLYAARCALLHAFSAETEMHATDDDIFVISYHDGGKHAYDPAIDKRFVVLGTKSLINDYIAGVEKFLQKAIADDDLRLRISSKINGVIQTIPLFER